MISANSAFALNGDGKWGLIGATENRFLITGQGLILWRTSNGGDINHGKYWEGYDPSISGYVATGGTDNDGWDYGTCTSSTSGRTTTHTPVCPSGTTTVFNNCGGVRNEAKCIFGGGTPFPKGFRIIPPEEAKNSGFVEKGGAVSCVVSAADKIFFWQSKENECDMLEESRGMYAYATFVVPKKTEMPIKINSDDIASIEIFKYTIDGNFEKKIMDFSIDYTGGNFEERTGGGEDFKLKFEDTNSVYYIIINLINTGGPNILNVELRDGSIDSNFHAFSSDFDGAKAGLDKDNDGVFVDEDCDDDNAAVKPDATEICGDGVINDCNKRGTTGDLNGDGSETEKDICDADADGYCKDRDVELDMNWQHEAGWGCNDWADGTSCGFLCNLGGCKTRQKYQEVCEKEELCTNECRKEPFCRDPISFEIAPCMYSIDPNLDLSSCFEYTNEVDVKNCLSIINAFSSGKFASCWNQICWERDICEKKCESRTVGTDCVDDPGDSPGRPCSEKKCGKEINPGAAEVCYDNVNQNCDSAGLKNARDGDPACNARTPKDTGQEALLTAKQSCAFTTLNPDADAARVEIIKTPANLGKAVLPMSTGTPTSDDICCGECVGVECFGLNAQPYEGVRLDNYDDVNGRKYLCTGTEGIYLKGKDAEGKDVFSVRSKEWLDASTYGLQIMKWAEGGKEDAKAPTFVSNYHQWYACGGGYYRVGGALRLPVNTELPEAELPNIEVIKESEIKGISDIADLPTMSGTTYNIIAPLSNPQQIFTIQGQFKEEFFTKRSISDLDGDGYITAEPPYYGNDCNDNSYTINPGAAEICDGSDNNCDDDEGNFDNDPNTGVDKDKDGKDICSEIIGKLGTKEGIYKFVTDKIFCSEFGFVENCGSDLGGCINYNYDIKTTRREGMPTNLLFDFETGSEPNLNHIKIIDFEKVDVPMYILNDFSIASADTNLLGVYNSFIYLDQANQDEFSKFFGKKIEERGESLAVKGKTRPIEFYINTLSDYDINVAYCFDDSDCLGPVTGSKPSKIVDYGNVFKYTTNTQLGKWLKITLPEREIDLIYDEGGVQDSGIIKSIIFYTTGNAKKFGDVINKKGLDAAGTIINTGEKANIIGIDRVYVNHNNRFATGDNRFISNLDDEAIACNEQPGFEWLGGGESNNCCGDDRGETFATDAGVCFQGMPILNERFGIVEFNVNGNKQSEICFAKPEQEKGACSFAVRADTRAPYTIINPNLGSYTLEIDQGLGEDTIPVNSKGFQSDVPNQGVSDQEYIEIKATNVRTSYLFFNGKIEGCHATLTDLDKNGKADIAEMFGDKFVNIADTCLVRDNYFCSPQTGWTPLSLDTPRINRLVSHAAELRSSDNNRLPPNYNPTDDGANSLNNLANKYEQTIGPNNEAIGPDNMFDIALESEVDKAVGSGKIQITYPVSCCGIDECWDGNRCVTATGEVNFGLEFCKTKYIGNEDICDKVEDSTESKNELKNELIDRCKKSGHKEFECTQAYRFVHGFDLLVEDGGFKCVGYGQEYTPNLVAGSLMKDGKPTSVALKEPVRQAAWVFTNITDQWDFGKQGVCDDYFSCYNSNNGARYSEYPTIGSDFGTPAIKTPPQCVSAIINYKDPVSETIQKEPFIGDHLCMLKDVNADNNIDVWTSRTAIVAANLFGFAQQISGSDFSIFCDKAERALNKATPEAKKANNFCVLSMPGNKVAFGTSFNRIDASDNAGVTKDAKSFLTTLKAAVGQDINCDNVAKQNSIPGKFAQCNTNKVFYNKDINAVIYSPSGLGGAGSFSAPQLGAQFASVVSGNPKVKDFNRAYIANKGPANDPSKVKEVRAFIEEYGSDPDGPLLIISIKNIPQLTSDFICDSFEKFRIKLRDASTTSNIEKSKLDTPALTSCEKTADGVKIKGTSFVLDSLWPQLTAQIRLQ